MFKKVCLLLVLLYSLPALAQMPASALLPKSALKSKVKVNEYEIPRFMVEPYRQNNGIYAPDRYTCGMRKNLPYCQTRGGRPLSGTIVVPYGDNLAYENYSGGYQSGITAIYTPSGILLERAMYRKGLRHGEAVRYFYNGNTQMILHYSNGMLNGRIEEYDISGVKIGQMTYRKGWFKEGWCIDDQSGYTMHDRLRNTGFNRLIPCAAVEDVAE